METIFRKVLVSDRLPEKDNLYYDTDLGKTYFADELFWRLNIYWWLEKIELPNEETIEDWATTSDCPNPFSTDRVAGRIEGGQWMRDFVLAVTPK